MDKAIDIVLGNSLSYPLGSLDVDILEGVVPRRFLSYRSSNAPRFIDLLGGVVTADQVVDNIGVSNALFDRLSVVEVVLL